MTDREVMMAIYSAVEAVFERLTGERLQIKVPINSGEDQVSITSLGFFADRAAVVESR